MSLSHELSLMDNLILCIRGPHTNYNKKSNVYLHPSSFRMRAQCENASVERGRPVRKLLKLPVNTKYGLTSVVLVWMSEAA